MNQEINLLGGFTPPPKAILPAELILKILGGLIIVLAAVQGYTFAQKIKVDKEYNKLTAIQKLRGAELANLSEKLPKNTSSAAIKEEVDKLTKDISNKKGLLKVIGRENKKFSTFLQALARRIIPGVWLKEIHFDQEDHNLQLLGRTQNADLVPLFLAELTKEAVFVNVDFKQLKLAKPANEKLDMGFALRTIPDEESVYIFPEDESEEAKAVAQQQQQEGAGQGNILSNLVNQFIGSGGKENKEANLPSLGDILQRAQNNAKKRKSI